MDNVYEARFITPCSCTEDIAQLWKGEMELAKQMEKGEIIEPDEIRNKEQLNVNSL